MGNRYAARITALILLSAAVATPCSFDFEPALTFDIRPDAPVSRYVEGNLGVVLPGYARSHLFVAYRWFSGKPLTAAEQKGVTALLEYRLKEGEGVPFDGTEPQLWEQERARIRGVKPGSVRTDRQLAYGWFANCTGDAFATARATLRQRVKTFGAGSAAVRSWLDAQEIVFGNCDGANDRLPTPAHASLPAIIRADRAYQTGAAHFYARNYEPARRHLLAVACDPESPWRHTARLVAARALLRAATLVGFDSTESYAYDPLPMSWAERELRGILLDPKAKPIHEPARELLRFALFRTNPQQRLRDAVRVLTGGKASAGRIGSELADYTYLLDRNLQGTDDLTDWIRTFQVAGTGQTVTMAAAHQHALERWRSTKQGQWLVAALALAAPGDAPELLAASEDVPQDSRAYPTIAHHRARLLIATGERDAARAELDRVLSLDLPHSGRNLLLGQRRDLARSVDEFARDLRTLSVGESTEHTTADPSEWFLPPEAAAVMNDHMPADLLAGAAIAAADADPGIRDPIVAAAWTRALLLGRDDLAERLTPLFLKGFPALEPDVRTWEKAGKSGRAFAAATLVLSAGALGPYVDPNDSRLGRGYDSRRIDHLGRNWWCAGALRHYWSSRPRAPVPPFLQHQNIVAANEAEQKQLVRLGAAPTWMLRAILDYAARRPSDRRVPEALSRVVRETRWSCGDDKTARLAERAFRTLHRRYPQSQWAKETPYWYMPFRPPQKPVDNAQ